MDETKDRVIEVDDFECVKNCKVFGLYDSVRRAKFPMAVDVETLTTELTPGIVALAKSKKGEGHDNWLNGVVVQFDLTFSNKAWVEMERYHFIDFVSSQSTIHRITKFNLSDTYNNYVDQRIIEIMKEKVQEYNSLSDENSVYEERAEKYLEILYSNPAGFMITAGMTTNYRQLKTIYAQRNAHRLPEWRNFCKWIETLPYSEWITGKM